MKVSFCCVSVMLVGVLSSGLLAEEELNPETESRGDLMILQGAAGTEEYGGLFTQWSQRWKEVAQRGNLRVQHLLPEDEEQKLRVMAQFAELAIESPVPLWIVLIGHGTYDGREAKFNLAGPDLSAKELDRLLAPLSRTIIVINCASSSGPFIESLSQQNRITVTSTRSGDQVNFARFGDYLSQAIGDSTADLDKDEQTSLLEAFLTASRKTLEFYEADGRLPTEDALLDDNGDGKGTRATAFQGVRAVAQLLEAGVLLDGFRAHQIHLLPNAREKQLSPETVQQRDEIERRIELLRLRKQELGEDVYFAEVEVLFLELAKLLLSAANNDSLPVP